MSNIKKTDTDYKIVVNGQQIGNMIDGQNYIFKNEKIEQIEKNLQKEFEKYVYEPKELSHIYKDIQKNVDKTINEYNWNNDFYTVIDIIEKMTMDAFNRGSKGYRIQNRNINNDKKIGFTYYKEITNGEFERKIDHYKYGGKLNIMQKNVWNFIYNLVKNENQTAFEIYKNCQEKAERKKKYSERKVKRVIKI